MVYRILLFCGVLLSISTQFLYGGINDNIIFRHITLKDGLSQSAVPSMFKDREGFMWFEMQNGLSRYDGYSFKIYSQNTDDSILLPDRLRSVCEDNFSTIWFATRHDELLSFNKINEKFTVWKCLPDKSKQENRISNTCTDNAGHIFLLMTTGKIQLFDNKTRTFKRWEEDINIPNLLKDLKFESLNKGKQNSTWFIEEGGKLIYLQYEKKKFKSFNINPNINVINTTIEINAVQEINSEMVWVSTTNGFYTLNPKTAEFHYCYKLNVASDVTATSFLIDKDNILWIGSHNGLRAYDLANCKYYSFPNNPTDPFAFHGENILRIYEDNEGIIWIASEGYGLNIFSKGNNCFKTIRPDAKNSSVTSILKDYRGMLWIGLNIDGLKIYQDDALTKFFEIGNYESVTKDRNIYSIFQDSKKNVWLGQNTTRVSSYNFLSNSFKTWNNPVNKTVIHPLGFVSNILERKDTLWICCFKEGLAIFDLVNQKYLPYTENTQQRIKLEHSHPQQVYFDNKGKMWIATDFSGLLTKRNDTFKVFSFNSANKDGISSNCINCIKEDKPGFIWVGTYGGGLEYFDIKKEAFYHITEKDGLPSNYINCILLDRHGRLWISTDKGICCFTPKIIQSHNRLKITGSFKNYYEEDGLQGNEFNQNASFQDKQGLMYFGGTNGLNIFHPDSIKENTIIPPVFITGFRLFNRPVKKGFLKQAIEFTKELILPYTYNVISFEFAGLSFSNPFKNKYAYKMEGFDKDWVYTDAKQRLATYTNLDPGEYTFRVKASNNDGIWNKKGASIHIVITPPFYRTWWFICLLFTCFLGLTISIVRFASIRKYQKRFQEMEHQSEIENVRSRIARDIHDDIGSGLTQISLIAEIVKSNERKGKSTTDLIDKLNTSTRTMIDNLGEIVWTINPKHDTLNSLLSYFSNYISGFLIDTDIQYSIDFQECFPDKAIHPDLRRNLFMVLKEAITNITKHSHARNAGFEFCIKENWLYMIIKDDGIGIITENKSQFGNGLKNMQSRMQNIGGILEINTSSEGTIITLKAKVF